MPCSCTDTLYRLEETGNRVVATENKSCVIYTQDFIGEYLVPGQQPLEIVDETTCAIAKNINHDTVEILETGTYKVELKIKAPTGDSAAKLTMSSSSGGLHDSAHLVKDNGGEGVAYLTDTARLGAGTHISLYYNDAAINISGSESKFVIIKLED